MTKVLCDCCHKELLTDDMKDNGDGICMRVFVFRWGTESKVMTHIFCSNKCKQDWKESRVRFKSMFMKVERIQ